MGSERRRIAKSLKQYHDSRFTPGVYEHSIFGKVAMLLEMDALEVAHGHWTSTDVIVNKAGYGVRYYYHAECKVNPHRLFECENDYCPNCGAKMDGDTNE